MGIRTISKQVSYLLPLRMRLTSNDGKFLLMLRLMSRLFKEAVERFILRHYHCPSPQFKPREKQSQKSKPPVHYLFGITSTTWWSHSKLQTLSEPRPCTFTENSLLWHEWRWISTRALWPVLCARREGQGHGSTGTLVGWTEQWFPLVFLCSLWFQVEQIPKRASQNIFFI